MKIIENRHYKALELHKVLEMLAQYTACEDSRYEALNLEPQTELALAQSLLNQTQDAHMMLARFGGPSFGGLRNVNNALSIAHTGSTLNMKDLLDVAQVLKVIRGLSDWRSKSAGVETCLDVFFGALTANKYLEERITTAVLSEDEMADNASPELYDIRRKIRVQSSKIREKLDQLIRSPHYQKFLQEPIVTMRNGRYVVPVKSECRGDVTGLVHDTSASGATVFIEPMAVVEANNEIKVFQSKERDEIERILAELSAEVGSFAEDIKASYECAVELNLIFAKAQLAYTMKAAVPKLNDQGVIELRNARHPLIDPKQVVPTDIRLGKEFDTLMITGPNTGGKTVSIKTIGLLCLMAMCGLMIPVSDQSTVSVFKRVLADIGDEQSIEQSLSTFSAHMTNIIEIINVADEDSLVLIDELGAGTDPVEGAALAMAILERLHINGAKIAATTHYAELKAYALQTPRVENGSCEFDVATLRPTYKLLIGIPGKSNAFAISERLGMEHRLVERAKEFIETDKTRFEDVVDKLEESRRNMEDERKLAQELHRKAEQAKQEAEKRKQGIEDLVEKELERARGEAMRIVERAKRESYTLLSEIEQLKKEKDKAKDIAELARRAKSQIKRHMDTLEDVTNPIIELVSDEEYVLPRELLVGDTVLISDLGKTGIVLDPADKKGTIEVQAGAIKMRVKLSTLRLLEGEKKKEIPKTRTVKSTESRLNAKVETQCDLRGKTVEEALLDLDRFVDSVLRTGIENFTVIHGKGTGALRAAVHQYLKGNPLVKSFRLGMYGEGDHGVTLVELK